MSVDEWLEKMDMTECLDKGPFNSDENSVSSDENSVSSDDSSSNSDESDHGTILDNIKKVI